MKIASDIIHCIFSTSNLRTEDPHPSPRSLPLATFVSWVSHPSYLLGPTNVEMNSTNSLFPSSKLLHNGYNVLVGIWNTCMDLLTWISYKFYTLQDSCEVLPFEMIRQNHQIRSHIIILRMLDVFRAEKGQSGFNYVWNGDDLSDNPHYKRTCTQTLVKHLLRCSNNSQLIYANIKDNLLNLIRFKEVFHPVGCVQRRPHYKIIVILSPLWWRPWQRQGEVGKRREWEHKWSL